MVFPSSPPLHKYATISHSDVTISTVDGNALYQAFLKRPFREKRLFHSDEESFVLT